MADYKWKFGDLILEVWETNKAHALGYCKWQLLRCYPDLPIPEILDSSGRRYMVVDEAIQSVFSAFYQYANVTLKTCDCEQYFPVGVTGIELGDDGKTFELAVTCFYCWKREKHSYPYTQHERIE